jgi:hypothetical protein
MKFSMKQTTPETAPVDLDTAVANAVAGTPSRAKLIAAKERLSEVTASANSELAEIERLEKRKTAKDDGNLAEMARDFLASKVFGDEDIEESLVAARRRAEVLKEAIQIQSATIRKLESDLYNEVNSALKSVRQPLVARMDAALQELQVVTEEDARLRASIGRNGVKAPIGGGVDFVTLHPVIRGLAAFQNWRACMKAQGYVLIERTTLPAAESAVRLPA